MSFPIAIVGIAAELPSGNYSSENLDYAAFCKFLLDHGEAYQTIPRERFNVSGLTGNALGQVATDTGTFLKDIGLFDYVEFGITSKDARLMGVSTRKLIELTFLSLLDAQIDYRGKNIGCYMSGVAHDMFSISGQNDAESKGSFAYGPAMVANRVSYHLDLRGPSIPIDTACSSSLHATHLAAQALRLGECDAAVVGGCQINHRFAEWLVYTQGGVLSLDGKCKPFDSSADGFGRGEGAVVMVLKPLHHAINNREKIYATILGTAINSSGSLAPVNAPVASAQQDTMIRAFAQAQRNPAEVDFIELHATGTALGDPTEANWVGEMFKRDDANYIGSVKGNIGHLEITAFLASLCKVCFILQSGIIPANVNLVNCNPSIHWDEYKLEVPLHQLQLPCHNQSGQSMIAMTSFGIGGANGACIVEAGPLVYGDAVSFWDTEVSDIPRLFIAGGLSPRSASSIAESISKNLPFESDINAIAHCYNKRSLSMTWKNYAIHTSMGMTSFGEPAMVPKVVPKLVFVFCGQGPQHLQMGKQLFKTCLVFRKSVLEMDNMYRSIKGESLIETMGLFASDSEKKNLPSGKQWPIGATLPALTILQVALIDTLASLGIKPEIVVGHSAGETAALYACGAGSKAFVIDLAIARDTAMHSLTSANGTMAALSCSPAIATQIIKEVCATLGPGSLEIGCYNAPEAVTLSGGVSHINLAVSLAQTRGIFARRLHTQIPVHSSLMDLCQNEYKKQVESVFSRHQLHHPHVPIYSSKTGAAFDDTFDSEYFWNAAREAVLFDKAVDAILNDQAPVNFLEVGPHPVLANYLAAMSGKSADSILCPLTRPKGDIDSGRKSWEPLTFVNMLGKLSVAGYRVDFDTLFSISRPQMVTLPPYPFAPKEVPYVARTLEVARQRQTRNGPLNYHQLQLNDKMHPALAEHVIKGEPIMPAAGYIEMMLEHGARELWNVEFLSILGLSNKYPLPIYLKVSGSLWEVYSSSSDILKDWPMKYNRLHAKGHMELSQDEPLISSSITDIPLLLKSMTKWNIDAQTLYKGFHHFAVYGITYQRILSVCQGFNSTGNTEYLIKVAGKDNLPSAKDYHMHPAILDSALHLAVHPLVTGNRDPNCYYLPSKLGNLTTYDMLFARGMTPVIYTHLIMIEWSPSTILYDASILTEDGNLLCFIQRLEVALHGSSDSTSSLHHFELAYESTDLSLSPKRLSDREDSSQAEMPSGNSLSVHRLSQSHLVVVYKRGAEMDVQSLLLHLDPLHPYSVWFIANNDIHGYSLLGFTRSLRREYKQWKIGAIIFDSRWPLSDQIDAGRKLSQEHEAGLRELELYVNQHGHISLPRIVSSAPLNLTVDFDPKKPWVYDGKALIHVSRPFPQENHVVITVEGILETAGSLWAFAGKASNNTCFIGIHSGPFASVISPHQGALLDVSDTWFTGKKESFAAVSMAVGILGVGIASFTHPHRLANTTILVTNSDYEFYYRIRSTV